MAQKYTIVYFNNGEEASWTGMAKSLEDALKRSQINPDRMTHHAVYQPNGRIRIVGYNG